jgi:hypothetical protein
MRSPCRHLPHAGKLFDLKQRLAEPYTLPDVFRHFQKITLAGSFPKRQQAQTDLEYCAGSLPPGCLDVQNRFAGLHPFQVTAQLLLLFERHGGEMISDHFLFA